MWVLKTKMSYCLAKAVVVWFSLGYQHKEKSQNCSFWVHGERVFGHGHMMSCSVSVPAELEGNERWLQALLHGLRRFTHLHTHTRTLLEQPLIKRVDFWECEWFADVFACRYAHRFQLTECRWAWWFVEFWSLNNCCLRVFTYYFSNRGCVDLSFDIFTFAKTTTTTKKQGVT